MAQQNIFSSKSLARVVRAGDSQRFQVDLKNNREKILDEASQRASNKGITLKDYYRAKVKGKSCISYTDYGTNLVLRSLAAYITRRFRVTAPNRDQIVKGVIEGLMDATPMYVIRRDITSFYESVPLEKTRDKLLRDTALPRLVRHYIAAFFDEHCSGRESGLPRGIGLTAVIVELAMEDFDRRVRSIDGVYKYFRYSDDILIFAYKNHQSVIDEINKSLPQPMSFNPKKSDLVNFNAEKNPPPPPAISFEYLGYKFSTTPRAGGKHPREVQVSVSSSKIKRLQSKVMLSLKSHKQNPLPYLLIKRLQFLTGNYRVHRRGVTAVKKTTHVRAGLYFNYRRCGTYGRNGFIEVTPPEFSQLDNFLHGLLRGQSSPFSTSIRTRFSAAQLKQLSRISFEQGFSSRTNIRLTHTHLSTIKSAWRNV